MTDEEALDKLADDEGYESAEEMILAVGLDSVVPGICPVCGYSTEVEPDQDKGWCEECDKDTVKSCLILFGAI